jgi:hypothetical protein
MKKLLTSCAMAAVLAGLTVTFTACPGSNETPTFSSGRFSDVEVGYNFNWYDIYNPETEEYESARLDEEIGIYYIALWDEDYTGYRELYIEFSSDYFEDFMKAVPAAGTYTVSDWYEPQTFNSVWSYYLTEGSDGEIERGITGGSFTITRVGYGFYLDFDLVLEDGEPLKGSYKDVIYTLPVEPNDVTVDLEESDDLFVGAYEDEDLPGLWRINFEESSYEHERTLTLVINTENGLTRLPAGRFDMADEDRKGVPGTAEPTSYYYDDWDPLGCSYSSEFWDEETEEGWGYTLSSVPSKGFVEIADDGGYDYSIEFSYETVNGKKVSGSYSGPVYQYSDEDWRAPEVRTMVAPVKPNTTKTMKPRFGARRPSLRRFK